jgi:hypothetical protein
MLLRAGAARDHILRRIEGNLHLKGFDEKQALV